MSTSEILAASFGVAVVIATIGVVSKLQPCGGEYSLSIKGDEWFLFKCIGSAVEIPSTNINKKLTPKINAIQNPSSPISGGNRSENSSETDILVKNIIVEIKTGSVKNAGTNAKVYIKLAGKQFRLETPKFDDFQVGSLRQYKIPADSFGITMGALQSESIQLSHDNSGSYKTGDPAWYVDYIKVYYSVDDNSSCLLEKKDIGWLSSAQGELPSISWKPPFNCNV